MSQGDGERGGGSFMVGSKHAHGVGDEGPLIDSPKGTGRRLRGALLDYLGTRIVTGQVAPGETLWPSDDKISRAHLP